MRNRRVPCGLTAAQIEARRDCLGGSDAPIVAGGDRGKIQRLIDVKRGVVKSDDLSGILAVKMGIVTERLNLDELENVSGLIVTNEGESRRHPTIVSKSGHRFMGNTLDGMTVLETGEPAVVQAKHTHAGAKLHNLVEQYYAQLHHEMIVNQVRHAVLTVLFGNSVHKWVIVDMDDYYAQDLIDIERKVWDCVETGIPWDDVLPMLPTIIPEVLRSQIPVDMTGNNAWVSAAFDWRHFKPFAEKFKNADKLMKSLLPETTDIAYGGGVQVSRSKDKKVGVKLHQESAEIKPPEY